jgi:hypothetical protein
MTPAPADETFHCVDVISRIIGFDLLGPVL